MVISALCKLIGGSLHFSIYAAANNAYLLQTFSNLSSRIFQHFKKTIFKLKTKFRPNNFILLTFNIFGTFSLPWVVNVTTEVFRPKFSRLPRVISNETLGQHLSKVARNFWSRNPQKDKNKENTHLVFGWLHLTCIVETVFPAQGGMQKKVPFTVSLLLRPLGPSPTPLHTWGVVLYLQRDRCSDYSGETLKGGTSQCNTCGPRTRPWWFSHFFQSLMHT